MWRDYPTGFPQLVVGALFGLVVLAGLLLTLAGRSANRPQMRVFQLSREFTDDFALDADDWRSPVFAWADADSALLGSVPAGAGYAVAVRDVLPRNVAVEVTARASNAPLSGTTNVGVMCRANAAGDGYYFLLSSSGRVSIQKALPGAPDLEPLVDWTEHPAIEPLEAGNTLYAACVADYLALYVNGEFAAQARDDDINSGAVGVTLAGSTDNGSAPVRALFDDVTVWEAAARR